MRPPSTAPHHRAGAIPRLGVILAVAVALPAAALGCRSSKPDASAPPTTTTAVEGTTPGTATDSTDAGRQGFDCTFRMPGEILTADEAVVRFDQTGVCPGYVTIAPGTAVTWQNTDTVAHTVTITEGNLPGGNEIATGTVPPGGTWVQTFDSEGFSLFVTDAIPAFRGVVEVTARATA
jgi:plastocyanin